jgi:hypothetical protein
VNVYIVSIHTMKSMVSLIRLYQDMTYIRKKRPTQDNKILVSKKEEYQAEITMGASIFRERKPSWKFWTHGKDIAILLDGCPKVLTLEPLQGKPALNLQFGSREDTNKFINKVVNKSKADTKPITNLQFIVLAMLIGIVVVLQIIIMQRG